MVSDNPLSEIDEALLLDTDVETRLERNWTRQRHYGFSVCGLNLLLPLGVYSELLVTPDVAPLPNSPSHFYGLTNVRGNLVPVYRLHTWLAGEQPQAPPELVLVVDQPQRGAALATDGKPLALDVAIMVELESVPDTLAAVIKPHVERVYMHNGEHWYLINHQTLFAHLAAVSAESRSPLTQAH